MKLLEIIQDENGKLSSSRILTLIFGLSAVVIAFYTTITNTITGEYNILIGVLTSSAIGNKFIGGITNKDKSVNVDTQK